MRRIKRTSGAVRLLTSSATPCRGFLNALKNPEQSYAGSPVTPHAAIFKATALHAPGPAAPTPSTRKKYRLPLCKPVAM